MAVAGDGLMITAVVMVRDEEDILPAWLRHAAAVCDSILVVDHGSKDATPAILHGFAAAGMPLRIWRMDDPKHWHSAVSTALTRHAFASGADWVLPIDADEFVDVENRAHLRTLLDSHGDPLAFWRWRNAVPDEAALESERIDWDDLSLVVSEAGPHENGKAAVHRSVSQAFPGFRLGSGNHRVHALPFAKPTGGRTVGALWHIPFRSKRHLVAKLRRDLASYSNQSGGAVFELEDARNRKIALLERALDPATGTDTVQQVGLGYWTTAGQEARHATGGRVRVRANIPMIEAKVAPAAPPALAGDPPAGPVTYRAVRAELGDTRVRLTPDRGAAFIDAAESALKRYFTPGFKLCRFVATRLARRRLPLERASRG